MTRLAALLFILPAAAQTGNWQAVEALPEGTAVQVQVPAGSTHGQLGVVSETDLTLNLKGGQRMFAREDIRQVSVRKPGHRGRNALIGLAIGAGAGTALALAAASGGGGLFKAHAIPPVVGGPAALGTMIGAALPSGGWTAVYKAR
jgi:hypothetical protein